MDNEIKTAMIRALHPPEERGCRDLVGNGFGNKLVCIVLCSCDKFTSKAVAITAPLTLETALYDGVITTN